MVQLSYEIFNKKTGCIVMSDFGLFDSVEYFFAIMSLRYGYNTKYYDFYYSGAQIR